MDAIQQLLSGLQKIPTAIAGGPVDLSNLVLGVLSGKGLSGVAEKPVGGSAWLNEKFGIQGEGLISDAVEMVGSSINPAGLAKSLAILVPAIVTKDANTILKAQRALKKGADPAEVFADTGIYKNPASKDLMSVISDANSRLRTENPNITQSPISTGGPTARLSLARGATSKLSDLLDHPELFDRVPDLDNIEVRNMFGGFRSAEYNSYEKLIRMGATNTPKEFQSILLHETQHGVQDLFDLPFGGNTGMFYANKPAFDEAASTILDLRTDLHKHVREGTISAKDAVPKGESLNDWIDLLDGARRSASKNYLSLAGEAEARLVQNMFETSADPVFAKMFPPNMMEAELGRFGITPDKLLNPADPLPKVDQDPVIQAIIRHIAESKATK